MNNVNLRHKVTRTWEDWENHSKKINVVIHENCIHFKKGQNVSVFEHPYDRRFYIVSGSWKDEAHKVKLVFRSNCIIKPAI